MWKRKSKPDAAQEAHMSELWHIEPGFRKGRNLSEGYARGSGIEFGDLRRVVARDPDFRVAYQFAEGRTLLSFDRIINLFLIIKFCVPHIQPGHIIEFGSYNGGSALFMASLAQKFLPNARVFALDTYAGMPLTDKSVDAHVKGDFETHQLADLTDIRDKFGLRNLEFVQGIFEDTASTVMSQAQNICLTHIDCDIYEAVKFSYQSAKAFMVPRGYFVFDDPTTSTCLGAMEAVEQCVIQDDHLHAEQVFPHLVFRQPDH